MLNNGYGADWDSYVKQLFTILLSKQIAALGITDYFTIDGYKKLTQEYLNNPAKMAALFTAKQIEAIKRILVIPSVEFRSEVFVGPKSVNFHVIFSEVLPPKDIEEKFLHEIDFVYQGEPQSEDKKRKLKEINLKELGAQLKKDHPHFDGSDILVGMMNAVVDHKQVSKILAEKENTFGGNYLFGVAADEDLSKISWNSRDHHTRKVLIQKSDFLFTSNPATCKWAMGNPPYQEGAQKFISEFKTLKPCIHGSDAHEYALIGHPCAKRTVQGHNCATSQADCDLRYCWIKADLTFEGLKQILYEPEERIVIQAADPKPLKSSQCINRFRIEAVTLDPELAFAATDIPINEGLVAVTGGKGSGKTALVDLIANSYESRAFCDDKNSFVKRVSEGLNPTELRTSITLQSGQEHAKEAADETFIEGVSIVYVAQGELEKHVEDPAHLETYINRLIFTSNEVTDTALLFDYQNIGEEIASLVEVITGGNETIFDLEVETDPQVEGGIKIAGRKLFTELQDVQKKIEELAKSLSPDKIKEAEEKQKQLTDLRERKAQLNDLGTTVRDTLKFLEDNLAAFNAGIEKINSLAGALKLGGPFALLEYRPKENLNTLLVSARSEMRKTISDIEKFQKELDEKERGVKEHARLLDRKKELEKEIQALKERLAFLATRKKALNEARAKRQESFRQLLAKRVEEKSKYLGIISRFASNKNDILNDLEFTADLTFDKVRFEETMSELVDLRRIRVKASGAAPSDIDFFTNAMLDLAAKPTEAKVSDIASSHVNVLVEKIVTNQKSAATLTRQTIYNMIFADYLNVVPSVKYKKVKLSKLSLGQKATVLLKIYLAQGEIPIIIDSHDDHLDNEFIMEELVKAVRQAKQHRQVVIVSNNGNVVVNSDAEHVVVACRDNRGQISYLSGSLENPGIRIKLLSVLEGGEEAFNKRQQKYRLHL